MIAPVYAGGVYYVTDEQIRLIPDEERKLHDTRRPVLVVSGPSANADIEWPFTLVCPLSTSTSRKTKYDIQLACGQGGVPKKCWVRIPAVQPLMKVKLGDQLGTLDGRIPS
ncbi:type II toxin-antitoxin system PemK/MazF family toxin [Streptomonospora litoralis]|uniref:PemK-like protein n=1 Tax=Streptomonospora litoralis TaxID=2498135 RepID=A0A4P6PVS1_9ACTN|nr:type II toxin-antitoxin system PemK/MazF family toxin [Streptomonospora litoralis]QBI52183.1 PemK-like protein [Streptomonospora litoralis]